MKNQCISQLSSDIVINTETHNGPQTRQWETSEYLMISEKPITFLSLGPGIIVRGGAEKVKEPEVMDDFREQCFLNKYSNCTDELKLLEIACRKTQISQARPCLFFIILFPILVKSRHLIFYHLNFLSKVFLNFLSQRYDLILIYLLVFLVTYLLFF